MLGPVLLLPLALVALLLPARYVLLPYWPDPLVEVVYQNDGGEVAVGLFEPAGSGSTGARRLRPDTRNSEGLVEMASADIRSVTRPRSAVVLLDRGGRRTFGYLTGVRDAESGDLLAQPGAWIDRATMADSSAHDRPFLLLIETPEGQVREVLSTELLHFYRPNGLSWRDRGRIFLRQFVYMHLDELES